MRVETDYAFHGYTVTNSTRFLVHWKHDPVFRTQVNYMKQNQRLLEVTPEFGLNQTAKPGSIFESFRIFEMLFDITARFCSGWAFRNF
jgi:hypothetical protein